jgi:coenzyme F420-reducing hydrogenase gamma subunit
MASSEMLRSVALVRTDVSEELSAPFIWVTRIDELVTASVVPSSPILVSLMMEELCSSEKSVLTRATLRNIPEDAILHPEWFQLWDGKPLHFKSLCCYLNDRLMNVDTPAGGGGGCAKDCPSANITSEDDVPLLRASHDF